MSIFASLARPWAMVSLFLLLLAAAATAQMESGDRGILPIDSKGLLEVDGIEVDVAGTSAQDARLNGWRIAQREGFAKLWARNSGQPVSAAPRLSDSTLDGLVSAIVVEREEIGPDRYIATLGVLFDRARAAQYVGISGNRKRSAPMLLVPLTVVAGTELVVERRNPWQRAWAEFRLSETPVDYVRLSGLGADPLLVNGSSLRRENVDYWKSVTDLYGAANLLVAEVTLDYDYPGGPVDARFVARKGLDREMLGQFRLRASGPDDMKRMMDEGARRVDAIYARAYARGDLDPDPRFIIREAPPPVEEVQLFAAIPYQVQMDTPSAAALNNGIARLRAITGVESVQESSLAIGGTSAVVITYRGDLNSLRSALAAAGWQTDYAGGVLRLSGAPQPAAPAPPPANDPAPPPAAPPRDPLAPTAEGQ
ncbi:heavy-metal-associated domain-containing protein [Sphingomicrobium lutaoense]|uniref:Heavy-metal-associated domain-containing protein n=1 Tax=Sphingomicrobium lutaoense TaxID=515949 RepID=A0A839YZ69_9SPHN|nr:heavy-metal-associated domain-containing protein [Sphingomicrobium lutaoense]MBB3763618.1 hypothetical protein [Sphingomicrobium lutaoense]